MGRDNWLLAPDMAQLDHDDSLRPVWIRLHDLHTALANGQSRGR
jgi:predicted amidohydrolase YtcJ